MWPRRAKLNTPANATADNALALQLGGTCVAFKLAAAGKVPTECFGLDLSPQPAAHLAAGNSLAAGGFLVHPGPYPILLQPHPLVSEIVLALKIVLDQSEPHLSETRFDLFLRAEAPDQLTVSDFCAQLQECVQQAVQSGQLRLETCANAHEWQQFRSGLEKLFYVRFGWSVESCLPQDRGLQSTQAWEHADELIAAASTAVGTAQPVPKRTATSLTPTAPLAAPDSRKQLRRLYLELPVLMQGLRLLPWPADLALFAQRQHLLHQLDMLSTQLATPAANAKAQDVAPLLERAWAMLAHLQSLLPAQLPAHMPQLMLLADALYKAAGLAKNQGGQHG